MTNLGYVPTFVSNPNPSVYITGRPLFLDFETTTHNKGLAIYKDNSIVLACWRVGWDGPMKSKWGGEFELQELLDDIAKCDFIVAHHSKFELQWLARCGLALESVLVYDTMIAEYVIGGNRWQTGRLSLEQCLQRHGLPGKVAIVSKMIHAGVDTRDIPTEWLQTYCERDVDSLPRLMLKQLAAMQDTRLLNVVYCRCLLTPVLADIETQGLQLDVDLVRTMHKETKAAHDKLLEELNEFTGGVSLTSTLQLATYLYDTLKFEEHKKMVRGKWVPKRTPTNRRLTGAEEIGSLKAQTKEQATFLRLYREYRNLYSQLTKYLNKWVECCDKNGGLLFAQFNQTATQTHRLSSSGLVYKTQFQNLPRKFKRLFRARVNGWLMGEGDGAQLEFRIAVHQGRDEQGLSDIRAKVDVHTFTAETLTEAGQPTDRQTAKSHTFKPLYGGSSGTPAEQTYYRAFKAKYPGIAKAQSDWIHTVLRTKQLETEWGLVYYWPDTKMDASGYISNTSAICNYPVQALATAEVIPLALVWCWHRLKRMGDCGIILVNTVHDSLAAEVRPGSEETFIALMRQCLINDAHNALYMMYGVRLICPLGCGIKIGTHWGQGEEVKFDQEEEADEAQQCSG